MNAVLFVCPRRCVFAVVKRAVFLINQIASIWHRRAPPVYVNVTRYSSGRILFCLLLAAAARREGDGGSVLVPQAVGGWGVRKGVYSCGFH